MFMCDAMKKRANKTRLDFRCKVGTGEYKAGSSLESVPAFH